MFILEELGSKCLVEWFPVHLPLSVLLFLFVVFLFFESESHFFAQAGVQRGDLNSLQSLSPRYK